MTHTGIGGLQELKGLEELRGVGRTDGSSTSTRTWLQGLDTGAHASKSEKQEWESTL